MVDPDDSCQEWIANVFYFRLIEADIEDVWLVAGMNRIRQAYMQLAADLEPYFVTSHHDDEAGILQTYSFRHQLGVLHLLSGSPVIVGIIDALLCGVVAAMATQALGGAVALQVAIGFLVVLGSGMVLAAIGHRRLAQLRRGLRPAVPELSRRSARAWNLGDSVGQALLRIRAASPSKIRSRPNWKSS
jgi:hypothetical protein